MAGKAAPIFALPVAANPSGLWQWRRERVAESIARPSLVVSIFGPRGARPVRAGVPILEKVSRAWQSQGIILLGVNVDGPDQGSHPACSLK